MRIGPLVVLNEMERTTETPSVLCNACMLLTAGRRAEPHEGDLFDPSCADDELRGNSIPQMPTAQQQRHLTAPTDTCCKDQMEGCMNTPSRSVRYLCHPRGMRCKPQKWGGGDDLQAISGVGRVCCVHEAALCMPRDVVIGVCQRQQDLWDRADNGTEPASPDRRPGGKRTPYARHSSAFQSR